MRYISTILIAIIFPFSCDSPHPGQTESPEKVFPGAQWETASPESQGVDKNKMRGALDELASFCGKDGLTQTIIIRNGFIIWKGDSTHKVHNVWSTSKSFTSTVLGLLIQQGKCNLDDLAFQWEPALDIPPYNRITLRHFTTMTSGYNAVGNSRWNESSADWSLTPYKPGKPIFDPGENYCYWDEAQMMFGRVLTRIAGKEIREVFQEGVGNPIGMGDFFWHEEGFIHEIPVNNGCTNVTINALQLARFGWFYLNEGNWKGKQLLNKDWIAQARSVQVPDSIETADTDRKSANGSGSYGYNWWVNAGEQKMPDSPKSLYYASGFNNNMCFVIPEWNMVVVRMGVDGNPVEPKYIAYNRFFGKLTEAVLK